METSCLHDDIKILNLESKALHIRKQGIAWVLQKIMQKSPQPKEIVHAQSWGWAQFSFRQYDFLHQTPSSPCIYFCPHIGRIFSDVE